jgi:hypothetical protein
MGFLEGIWSDTEQKPLTPKNQGPQNNNNTGTLLGGE